MFVRREESIAWAAGFFEGEGSITETGGRLVLRIHNTDGEALGRFAAVVERGKIYGPYENASRDGCRRKPFYAWVAHEREAVAVLDLFWRWLSTRRLARAEELLRVRPHLR